METCKIVRLAALHSLDAQELLDKQYPGFSEKSYAEQRKCLFDNYEVFREHFHMR